MRKFAVSGLVILVALIAALCALRGARIESGSGSLAEPSGMAVPAIPPTNSADAWAGARPSHGQVDQHGASTPEQGAHEVDTAANAGSSPALATTFASFADEMQPTADGLAAATIDLWASTPEFLRLSEDEVRELLPVDDDMGFRGPDSWVTLLGGLPTRDDIESALRDSMVRCALESACAQEMVYRDLQTLPEERRSAGYMATLESARNAYERSWELLMRTLDSKSKYSSWTLLWKAWQRWSE